MLKMLKMFTSFGLFHLFVVFFFLNCSPAPVVEPGKGDPVNTNASNSVMCTSASCPKGQFCYNGLCVVGCNVDTECASNQYCDTDSKQCSNKTIPTCPETTCLSNQECVKGYCSVKASQPPVKREESTSCQVTFSSSDGCTKSELCLMVDEERNQCRSLPRCPKEGACPVGVQGAVCNDGLLPDKEKFCLVGMCTENSHCPSQFQCVKPERQNLGVCSNGSLGMPCNDDSVCISGMKCMKTVPGYPGFCMTSFGIPFP